MANGPERAEARRPEKPSDPAAAKPAPPQHHIVWEGASFFRTPKAVSKKK